jgi:hypothetical protein
MIRKITGQGLIVVSGLLALTIFFWPQLVSAKSWYFEEFNSQITINRDSTFWVEESIKAKFKGEFSQFWRTIPHQKIDYISDIQLFDQETSQQLSQESYTIKKGSGGTEIAISQPIQDQIKSWQIKYLVHGALTYQQDWDELYLNVVPADRQVEIKESEAIVVLPQEIDRNQWKDKIYAETKEQGFEVVDGKTVRFWAKNLPAQSNFTIVLGWPKEIIEYHLNRTKIFQIIGVALPIFTLLIGLILWYFRGRDQRGRGTIAPEFAPPTDDPPILVGALFNERIGPKELTATLINLARKGYLRIIQEKKKILLYQSTNFIIPFRIPRACPWMNGV